MIDDMMGVKDLFITPLFLGFFYLLAYQLRARATNAYTKKYFIPALSLKFLGAVSLGIIYQFYYGGGDTFNYFTHTSIIHEAFTKSPSIALKLIFGSHNVLDPSTMPYVKQMYWYNSPQEYMIVRIAAFAGLFCNDTYSSIGLFFAILSFSGMWAMYSTFCRIFPAAYKKLAIAVFFLPSVFFWGSGLMKDSICIGALGWVFYGFYYATILKKRILFSATIGLLAAWLLVSIKVYIMLSFLPPALFWIFNENNQRIKSHVLRAVVRPLFLIIGLGAAYAGAISVTAGDEQYDINKIGERTQINSRYLSVGIANGSSYDIGTIDGSVGSILKVAPQAVIVSIFRPFLFEVRNPVMLLSALEATMFMYLSITLFWKSGLFKSIKLIASEPILTFCFIFSIVLAVGVGTNSGNFGTLVRYKIPLMPFYLSGLYIMQLKSQPVRRKAITMRRQTATA